MIKFSELNTAKSCEGLVPAIIQDDDTRQVLMLGYLNEEAFDKTVAEGRGMGVEEVRSLATGLPFTGTDAVENGLADEIGTREDAIAKAAELAGISAYTVVDLQPESDDLYAMLDLLSENDISADDVAEVLKELEDGTVER